LLTNYYLCPMSNLSQHIDSLIKKGGYKQSDIAKAIGAHRQLLSSVIMGKRELSMQMALKLESFFNLPEGKLIKMQVENSISRYKYNLKTDLVKELNKVNAFWSYANVSADNISDEELIEKTLIYLDMKDISKLFELYKRDYIRMVWRENMVIQGDYLFNLNVMIAMFYFDIKEPEQYLRKAENSLIKQKLRDA